MMGKTACLIYNPTSRNTGRDKINKAVDILSAGGLNVNALETSLVDGRPNTTALAKECIKESPAFVMAGGGDGTVNEVLNGLAYSGVPMAVLPLGMVNVLALEAGIPLDVEGAVRVAMNRLPRPISLGRIQTSDTQRYFCLMAGIGFDAKAVSRVNLNLKRHSGSWAYVLSGLKTLLDWMPDALEVELDGMHYKARSLIACNTSRYAGSFRIAPDADMTRPHLNVFLMHGGTRFEMARYIVGILTGTHLKLKGTSYRTAKNIMISGAADIQIDGDYIGKTPAQVEVVENALDLIY